MTQKNYAVKELSCYGFNKYEDIPEEMLDYLPENLDQDNDEDTLPWDFDLEERPIEKVLI